MAGYVSGIERNASIVHNGVLGSPPSRQGAGAHHQVVQPSLWCIDWLHCNRQIFCKRRTTFSILKTELKRRSMFSASHLRNRVEHAVAEDARVKARRDACGPPRSRAPPASHCQRPQPRRPRPHPAWPSQAIDTAKKKAMKQRADVETFELLVSAAQLQPIRGGLRSVGLQGGQPRAAALGFAPDGTLETPSMAGGSNCSGEHVKRAAMDSALRSGSHFVRAWRASACAAKRWQLLQRAHAAGALPRLLKLELNSLILRDFSDILCLQTPAASMTGPDCSCTAGAVLEAAAAATSFAVAHAGLPLQDRQRLAALALTLKGSGAASSRVALERYADAGLGGAREPVQP